MTIDAISIKGTLRMKIPIHLDGRIYIVDEFIDRYHNYNILRSLPPVYAAGNQELTPGGAMYYSSMHLYLKRNRRGWIVLDSITSPEHNARGTNSILSNLGFTHPHDLRHGKVSYFNPYEGYEFPSIWTAGKRLKLATGFRIKGYHPLPHEVGIPSGTEYADGIILVSSNYASQYRLQSSSNKYHRVDVDDPEDLLDHHLGMVLEDLDCPMLSSIDTTHGTSILSTGDKLAGVVPSSTQGYGYLVKGTVVIDPIQVVDIILPKDSIKASRVPITEMNRMYVRLRAAERVSTYDTRLSYQIGQFIPSVVAYRISTLLRVPLGVRDPTAQSPAVQSTISSDSRAHACVASTVPTEIELLSMLDLCTNLSKHVWDEDTKSTCITLFQWKEHTEDGSEVLKSIHWAEDISLGMNPYRNHRLMTAIQRELMVKISKMISPPVKGAWGVATPGTDIYTVSVPSRVYYHLGKPSIVACLRSPIKGKSSLVRMHCTSHEDTDSTIRVHPIVMKDIFAGDFDGDMLECISDPDIVSSATSISDSLAINEVASKDIPHIEVEYPQCTDISDAQAIVAGWRGDVGVVCNIRDSLYGAGLLSEVQCNKYFRVAFQSALAQMDGAPPIARYLLDNPGILADIVGVDVSLLLDTDGTLLRSPSKSLSAIRGNLAYNDFITVANEADGSTPHGILLSPFRVLPSIH